MYVPIDAARGEGLSRMVSFALVYPSVQAAADESAEAMEAPAKVVTAIKAPVSPAVMLLRM
ncbi:MULTISPECIES: hypothetical protein [Streptomyces]|nr:MULTISPECIES: hypothetical protein [Streptomyces]